MAQEVASRLDSIAGVQLRSKDLVSDDKTFFYVNAVAEEGSALEKITKQYNNVTWKRCKLVVRAARPHFLERLALERLQRRNDQESQQLPIQKVVEKQKIPRHLRIRKKYGEEAYHVDTKPRRANDWAGFCRALEQMHRRRQAYRKKLTQTKQHDEIVPAKKKAFLNRSVHLQWKETWDGNNAVPSFVGAEEESVVEEESTTESSGMLDDNAESDIDEKSSFESSPPVNRKSYVWSEDESDETSSSEDHSAHSIKDRDARDDIDDLIGGTSDESISSESEAQAEDSLLMPEDENVNTNCAQDEWSNEVDKREVAISAQSPSTTLRPNQTKADTEEFSPALDFQDSDGDEDDIDGGDGDSALNERMGFPSDAADLFDDVKSNLGILSTLFPEMANTTPRLSTSRRNTDEVADEEQSGRKLKAIQPGWEMGATSSGGIPSISAGLGLMQRFDPTKESAKKYVIEPLVPPIVQGYTSNDQEMDEDHPSDKDNEDLEEKSASRESPSVASKSGDVDAESEVEKRDDARTAIYEQAKLEDIFRQVRASEGSQSFKLSSMFDIPGGEQTAVTGENSKSFAFGFDVGKKSTPGEQAMLTQSGPFAFSFDLGKKSPVTGQESEGGTNLPKTLPNKDSMADYANRTNDTGDEKIEQTSTGIRRRGLLFPEDVLNTYADAFFSMNEGSRILRDPQGFLHDEGVKSQWTKERHALTLDWKRKRKYTQSRMQKKMKFR
jgi:hypothetical protein